MDNPDRPTSVVLTDQQLLDYLASSSEDTGKARSARNRTEAGRIRNRI